MPIYYLTRARPLYEHDERCQIRPLGCQPIKQLQWVVAQRCKGYACQRLQANKKQGSLCSWRLTHMAMHSLHRLATYVLGSVQMHAARGASLRGTGRLSARNRKSLWPWISVVGDDGPGHERSLQEAAIVLTHIGTSAQPNTDLQHIFVENNESNVSTYTKRVSIYTSGLATHCAVITALPPHVVPFSCHCCSTFQTRSARTHRR